MKRHLLSIAMLMLAVVLMAAPVSEETTGQIADFFFHEHGGKGNLRLMENNDFRHLRIYQCAEGNGFVIMPADDCVLPILGYSTVNPMNLDDMAPSTRFWFEEYDRQIEWNIENDFETNPAIVNEWSRLANMIHQPQLAPSANSSYNTANLLTTTWAQNPYFNNQCPEDTATGKHAVTGCVATAMAQIMKYWEHPQRGIGSNTYEDPLYGTQSADFADTVFDYAAMPNLVNAYSTASAVNAVALLCRRCGIAVEMEYGLTASSASTIGKGKLGYASAENAYREYFKYMHTLHSVSLSDYEDTAWVSLLKNEIDNGRPVQYSAGDEVDGGGHSFICCGYDNTGKLYFNWGWKGFNDGYYQIGQLNPGSHHYNDRNKAIIGIEPDTSNAMQTTVTLVPNIQNAGIMMGDGTYNSYEDTVSILAMANPGYIFSGWNDDMQYNPYQFLANGGNVTHHAVFEKMHGDTLGYCYDGNVNAYGSKSMSTKIWAIRLDSNSIAQRRSLTDVDAYISEPGEYMLHVFQGVNANSSTLVYSDTFDIYSSQDETWVRMRIASPVNVDRSMPLWIALETTCSGYPKSYSVFRGNIDGAWSNSDINKNWTNYVTDNDIYLSWQIRGVFVESGSCRVDVVSADKSMGTATGGGSYPKDTTIVIKAIPNEGYHFLEWQDGNTEAVRSVVVNDHLSFTAYFEKDEEPSAIGDVSADVATVFADDNIITVRNASGSIVNIYDATGRMVVNSDVKSSHETFSVPAGIYFVRIGNSTRKFVVK